jgi:transposase-like protein
MARRQSESRARGYRTHGSPIPRDGSGVELAAATWRRRYGVHANQTYKWKREFIERAALAFGSEAEPAANSEREEEPERADACPCGGRCSECTHSFGEARERDQWR